MAGLVLLLGLLAVNPDAHAWLHGHDTGTAAQAHAGCTHDHPAPAAPSDDAGCVVTQFANGQLGLDVEGLIVEDVVLRPEALLSERSADPASVRDLLLPPGCGPPKA